PSRCVRPIFLPNRYHVRAIEPPEPPARVDLQTRPVHVRQIYASSANLRLRSHRKSHAFLGPIYVPAPIEVFHKKRQNKLLRTLQNPHVQPYVKTPLSK